ncbi:DUF2169 domain-containing protein [Sorangium sp. So ce429]
MRLRNTTSSTAVLQHADFGTDDRYAVVIWKLTYDLPPADGWSLSSDPMPITGDLVETDFGVFHGDIFLRKVGVDLGVLGRVRLSRPVEQTTVTLHCGAFSHSLRVTGDRVWVPTQAKNGLVPSKPVPFTQMDLSYARAFGGMAQFEGMPVPFSDNPMGRGYHLDRDDAVGKLLPNIEAAVGAHIASWEDRPVPAGWGPYPMHWGLRARSAVAVDPALGAVADISPAVFNNAHPDLVLPEIQPGARVELVGVYDNKYTFSLPRLMGNVHVQVGDRAFDVPTSIDGVFIWLDAGRLVITQRANFRYVVRPEEVRIATLTQHHV